MDKLRIMVSSTVEDLLGERDAILSLYSDHPVFETVGAKPFIKSSSASSSAIQTVGLAKRCDLYLLIMGEKYGYELTDGRSATEVEYDAAYHQDPTKVLVFLKKGNPEPKQREFITKVSRYYSGYWRVEFEYTHQLQRYVEESVMAWLKDRASLNNKVSYCEHFIREAIQLKPTPETAVFYSVREDYVEIEYHAMGQKHTDQYEKSSIYTDFWRTLYELQADINRWSTTW